MKEYIKTLLVGVITGATAMEMMNLAAIKWLERPFTIGGEYILPVLLAMVMYIGWKIAGSYFNTVTRREIYRRGYNEGAKLHNYRIVVNEDDISQERT